jgi:RsiW-degrading membrane proteinase PrsW (M82 family)
VASGDSALLSETSHQTTSNIMGSLGMQELVILFVIAIMVALVGVLPFWFICKKAGLSPWLSLIMIVPFGALILPFVLAFIDWPALRGNGSTPTQS